MNVIDYLPTDGFQGTLVSRVWYKDAQGVEGPAPVLLKEDGVYLLTQLAPTMSALLERETLVTDLLYQSFPKLCDVNTLFENSVFFVEQEGIQASDISPEKHLPQRPLPYLLAPNDTQAIKACGVTFACSMLERVIEERVAGDAKKAQEMRTLLGHYLDVDLDKITPGSKAADEIKEVLVGQGLWSQYLEVGLGPYAEVFTKSQPMSAVGLGAEVGLHRVSEWNNPEPELVLAVNSQGKIVGATLGNDVNLRDVEGRSALLLGKAKDNNASCAIGPFIRLFDSSFGLDDVKRMRINLTISGPDGFEMNDFSDMTKISRQVEELVEQTFGAHHQYPDGFMLFTGTLFAPTQDRDEFGSGFTHKIGDVVDIRSEELGMLRNRVNYSDAIAPWRFGVTALMQNLATRKLL